MGTYIFFLLFVLVYVNLIRYYELRHYSTMQTLIDYFIHMNGIVYNLNIILVAVILFIAGYINN